MIDGEVLETLNDIKDLLTPKLGGPIEIKADDQEAINANLEAIASGAAVVVAPEAVAPVHAQGVRQIPQGDQRAINANLESIANGSAVVV